jgi:hypothetical protein
MKPSEAAEIVLMLMAAFPASKTLPTTSAVYECSLADLDAAVARKAVTRLIATRKWLPTVAEIRSAATDLRLGAVRDGGEAWKDAVAAVRYVGRYDVPAFPDPLVSQALRLWGSWASFCDSPEDDPGGRARFIELYDSLALRRREAEASGIPLPEPAAAARKLASVAPSTLPWTPLGLLPVMQTVARKRPAEAPPRRYTADELQAALDAKQGAA